MLNVGRERFEKSELSTQNNPKVEFLEQNAEELKDIGDNTIDTYTICFGIRNVPRISKALEEGKLLIIKIKAFRVLKKGGMIYVMECNIK
jgi:demethylmenaquinone methyltransferase / 2-methoxy-6-polyprenyl-1,4-benzoquinol methylase